MLSMSLHPSVTEKRQRFLGLHESGCLLIPNSWDPGSRAVFAAPWIQSAGDDQLGICLVSSYADGRP